MAVGFFTGAGGISGIDLTVVNGSTAPESPAENTIWVQTTTTIGDVYVSPTAPENPAEGDVWVNTTGNAVCTMTLAEDPTADVGISEFLMYENGAWVKATGGIQCGGVWYDLTAKVYGIRKLLSSSSPAWERIEASANFTATASVGTTAGSSDFDDCYPWSGMVRETLNTDDVMVKIPKFWYQRYKEDGYEYIKIADNAKDGFSLHPAFNHSNVEKDCVYVGAYRSNASYKSNTGQTVLTETSFDTYKSGSQAKGTGWYMIDISTVSAIQMLYLVEFATYDSQSAIGKGITSRTLVKTGTCDAVANLTGRAAGTDGSTNVVYRGIEGFWGNGIEYMDGINCYSTGDPPDTYGEVYYVCNDPSKYTTGYSSNAPSTLSYYTKIGFSITYDTSSGYILEEGLDTSNPFVMLPKTLGGSATTYVCDSCSLYTTASRWTIGGRGVDGIFNTNVWPTARVSAYSYVSSRLMYIPS